VAARSQLLPPAVTVNATPEADGGPGAVPPQQQRGSGGPQHRLSPGTAGRSGKRRDDLQRG
jgi:hypothetical protein